MKKSNKKIKIGILFGGKSTEHEVSIKSAENIINALDKKKYSITKIKIEKSGAFNLDLLKKVDVVFPVLHGPFGEDGTMQGFLKILGVPFVGPSILGSSVGFDKDITKRLLTEAGIANTKFLAFRKNEEINFKKVKSFLSLPMIIKPANSGSSIGIRKVVNQKEFNKAVKYAFRFDSKIIIEKFLKNKREIECAVLGNESPRVSVCGEVVTKKHHDFYSYEAKYVDETGADLIIPAKISNAVQNKIQKLAVKTFKILECEGLARVDFFLLPNQEILVNEINTIPGFTNISMYPMLWGNTGVSYSKLIDELIKLALERYRREEKLETSYK